MFPVYVDRLSGVPARIEHKVGRWPRAILTQRVNGQWSIQEHIGHLLDLEPLGMGRLDDYDAGLPVLRAADMTNRRTQEANHNARPVEEILKEFRAARGEFIARLEMMDVKQIARTSRHPRLNVPMCVVDLIQFIGEHDDHHLVRLNEVKLALAEMR
jgi:hypothetical protein